MVSEKVTLFANLETNIFDLKYHEIKILQTGPE